MNKFVPLLEKKGATGFKERATLTRPTRDKNSTEGPAIVDAAVAKEVNDTDHVSTLSIYFFSRYLLRIK